MQSRWFQEASTSGEEAAAGATAAKRVRINVGGQMFETTGRVLLRDPASVLAQLAARPPPDPSASPDGAWFFERDWWTFRFVLQWLREGESSLPRSKHLLRAIYSEARYFGMSRLRDSVRRVYQRIAAAEAEADAPGISVPARPAAAKTAPHSAAAAAAAAASRSIPPMSGWPLAEPVPALSGAFAATPSAALAALLRADGEHPGSAGYAGLAGLRTMSSTEHA
jgi:hypothetical protein